MVEDIDIRVWTRNHVIELSHKSPILHAALMYWHRGDWTWEEAMTAAAVALMEDNQILVNQTVDMMEKMPPADKLELKDEKGETTHMVRKESG